MACDAEETNRSCGSQLRSIWQSAEMQRYSIQSSFLATVINVSQICCFTLMPAISESECQHSLKVTHAISDLISTLVDFDAGILYDFGRLGRIGFNDGSKLLRRVADDLFSDVQKPLFHL